MTRMLFGLSAEDLDMNQLTSLRDHKSLYRDQLENRWEKVPERFRQQFGSKAVFLAVREFESGSRATSFLVEWDDMDWYLFRGDEIWIARSSRAHVSFRRVGGRWVLCEEVGNGDGDPWSAVPRLCKIAFNRPRAVGSVDIRPELLKQIVQRDSRADRYIWWQNVEDGVDGALRGALPRDRGFRARFDAVAKPTFARFESATLSKEVSISCRSGSISGRYLTPDEILRYFEQHILPAL
jgi:hypothetical protein